MKPKTAYPILCALGVLLPYWQLTPWLWEHGLDLPLFFRQLFENRVGAFFGMDVFVSAAALLLFAWGESRRAAWLVAASVLAVGVSLGLPLLLYLRERRLERGGRVKDPAEREALLMLRAQSGDREALDALLASVQEPLYRYVLTLVRERHLAEDI